MPKLKTATDHLYLQLAHRLEALIEHRLLKVGDKLPSVRLLSEEQGLSLGTCLQAYYHLEAKGLIESRPKSGYYVRCTPHHLPPVPATSDPQLQESPQDPEAMITDVFSHVNDPKLINLALGVPDPALLPQAKLNKAMVEAMRELPAGGTSYEDIQGNFNLRTQIARHALSWQSDLQADDLLITNGCANALTHCLMALTQAGDTIAVESPVYFGILQLARSLGLRVLELPTHPVTGIEVDALREHVRKGGIAAVLLVSNFSNPLGSCMPDEHKKEVVALLTHYGVPLIEDDIYGDVFFGKTRPKPCKAFDEDNRVFWCGSVSKTLAPGYRIGWVTPGVATPGRLKAKLIRHKLYQSISCNTLAQQAVARFLENGRYEHHLRRFRHTLHGNSMRYMQTLADCFPEGTRVSRPQGGFFLWVELPPQIDTYALFREAMKRGISLAPGRMFTLREQYRHCLRLSYGRLWTPQVEKALQTLGSLAKKRV
jgi:DNA-binding transcriptional MocR family regulator